MSKPTPRILKET